VSLGLSIIFEQKMFEVYLVLMNGSKQRSLGSEILGLPHGTAGSATTGATPSVVLM